MTTRRYGKPRSEKMQSAIARVMAGEVCYLVAKEMQIAPAYLYSAVKIERARASRLSQVPEPSNPPAPD